MRRSARPFPPKRARLLFLFALLSTLTGVAAAATFEARQSTAEARMPRVSADVNPWAAGDAAVLRSFAELGRPSATSPTSVPEVIEPESPTSTAVSPLPNLDEPAIRQLLVCRFEPGSFGISPELSNSRASVCGAAGRTNGYDDLSFGP